MSVLCKGIQVTDAVCLTAIPGSLRSVETDSSGKCTWNYTTTTKAFRFPFNPDNNPVTDHSSDRQRVKQQEILSSLMLRWPKLASRLPLYILALTYYPSPFPLVLQQQQSQGRDSGHKYFGQMCLQMILKVETNKTQHILLQSIWGLHISGFLFYKQSKIFKYIEVISIFKSIKQHI